MGFFGLRDVFVQLNRRVRDDDLVALDDADAGDDAGVGLFPQLDLERLAGEHDVGKADLDALKVAWVAAADLADDVSSQVAEGTQAVQDRLLEAKRGRKGRIDVQRVPVAAQSVDERLLFAELVGQCEVSGAIGRGVDVGRGSALAAEAACATDEGAQVVFGQQLTRVGVVGVDVGDDDGVFAFVVDLGDAGAVAELGFLRPGANDLGVLLAVEHAIEAIAQAGRGLAFGGQLEDDLEGGHHRKRRQGVEAACVVFVQKAQLFVIGGLLAAADAERVDGQVALVVAVLLLGQLVAERFIDIDELVAASALRRQVLHHRLHRGGDVWRVGGVGKVGDLRPGLGDVVDGKLAAQLPDLALGAFPAELGDEAAADLEQAAGVFAVFVAEVQHDGADVLGLERIDDFFGHHGLGES